MSRPRGLARQASWSVLAAVLVAGAAACGDDPVEPTWEVIEEVTYADAYVTAGGDTLDVNLGVMTETASGVWYEDIVAGTGDTVAAGDTLFIQYTGWIRDGTEFDSGSFSYILCDGRSAIGGMHYGVEQMQEGGERLVIIPPEWGYGNLAAGIIYSGAVLLFDIQLDSLKAGTPPAESCVG